MPCGNSARARLRKTEVVSSSGSAIRIGAADVFVGPHAMWPGENVLPHVRGLERLWPAHSARRRSRFDHREETMVEAPVVASPQRRGMDRARTAAPSPRPRGRPGPVALSQRLRPSEALRALNRERIGLVTELRCECGQLTCRDTLPLVAETHRGMADRFVVT